MKKIKTFILSLIVIFLANTVFSQTTANKFHKSDISHKAYFTLNDSVKTTAFVYNNKAAYKSVKIGLLSGAAGYVAGLGFVYLSMKDHSSCDLGCAIAYTFVPIFTAGLAFLTGTTIGYVINYEHRNTFVNYPLPKRPFKQIGINSAMLFPVSDNSSSGTFTFGLSYRNLYSQKYIPNRLSLNYGYNAMCFYYNNTRQDYTPIWSDQWHVGLEAVHIDYSRFFSFLYGLELGFYYSKASKNIRQDEHYNTVPYKNVAAPYVDLILGINVNLFHFLSWELSYLYEPLGIYEKLKPADAKIISGTHKIVTSLSLYFK